VVTGAARGIGRAIAVDMAANGADIVGIDICGKITPVQTYQLATKDDLEETGVLVEKNGGKFRPVIGEIRDIAFLRETADKVEEQFLHFNVNPEPQVSSRLVG
jgi:NAD(P)-dependent dehydrogenase (short-subunit alcohol dehydrogenase family)